MFRFTQVPALLQLHPGADAEFKFKFEVKFEVKFSALRGRRRGCSYFVGKQTFFHRVILHKDISETSIRT